MAGELDADLVTFVLWLGLDTVWEARDAEGLTTTVDAVDSRVGDLRIGTEDIPGESTDGGICKSEELDVTGRSAWKIQQLNQAVKLSKG